MENQSTSPVPEVAASHLRVIFENAQEAFVLLDVKGTILAFNPRARYNILFTRPGAKVEEGGSIYDFVEDERKEAFRFMYNRVLHGEQFKYEKDYDTPEGKTNWYEFSLTPVYEHGVITGVCVTGTNVNDRKRVEQELASSQQKFRGLVENSGDAVTIFSADGKATYFSPALTRVLGYTEADGFRLTLFELIHPDDLPFVLKAWQKVLASPGRTFFNNKCRILHADGRWRWIDGTLTNLLHDPAIAGIVDNFRDITDLVNSQQEQRVAVDRYRYLFNHNPVPMWIYEPGTLKFLEVNNAAIHRYGFTRTEFLDMTLLDIREQQEAEGLMEAVESRRGKSYHEGGVWKHRTKTGDTVYVEISSHDIVHNGAGGVLVLAHDVTERTKALDLLYKAYEEKTNILETIPNGFLRLDKAWLLTYWNREAERLLRVDRATVLGRNIWDAFPSTYEGKFFSEARRAMLQREQVAFEEYHHESGLWLDLTIYPYGDGLSVYFKDITEKKLIQENTRVAKERYETVTKATNDVIYEWDMVRNLNYWGEGYQTLFGYSQSGEDMPTDTFVQNLHPDERDEILASNVAAIQEKKSSLTRELRFRCADGTYKTVYDKLLILYAEDGKPVKIVGAMQDLTERKKSEDAVHQLNQTLNLRAEQLARSNEELERFAYVASHDLQEPLRMVSSFMQLLQKNYHSVLDERANKYIDFAVDGATRMRKLILDLLAYSQVSNKKEEPVAVDPNELMEGIVVDFHPRIIRKNVALQIDILPTVLGNEMQINQLFRNFISNAIKYNDSDRPEIHIGSNDLGDRIEFFVKDNGIGIDEKFKQKVFVIFQRLHQKNEYSGTGIGLAICKKIVELHGGKIRLESTPGKGSTFYFTLYKYEG